MAGKPVKNTPWLGWNLEETEAAFVAAFAPTRTLWLYCKYCQAWADFVIIGRWFCCPSCEDQKVTVAERTNK